MAVDPKIVEAIEKSVEEAGQGSALARRLVAWFGAIASGNEDINDRQSAYRHLELLYEETQTPQGLDDTEVEADAEDLPDEEGQS